MQNLNKTNFWDALMQKHPKAVQLFCDWMDAYKKQLKWNRLFNTGFDDGVAWGYLKGGHLMTAGTMTPAPKFHDLPFDLQIGILVRFFRETSEKYNYPFYLSNLPINLFAYETIQPFLITSFHSLEIILLTPKEDEHELA